MVNPRKLERYESDEQLKLNIPEQDDGYFYRPYSFFKTVLPSGRRLRRSELVIFGAIYSFSKTRMDPDAWCNFSFAKFEKKFNLSHGSVAKAIKALKDAELITQDKSNPAHASYQYINSKGTARIRTDFYLYHTEFKIKIVAGKGKNKRVIGIETRLLTKAEIDILSFIVTHSSNKKGPGYCEGSVRRMEKTLGLSHTTIQKGITTLLHANLIFRIEEHRGINGHVVSKFTANNRLLKRSQKAFEKTLKAETEATEKPVQRRAQTPQDAQIAAADARADREQYYAQLRQTALSRVQKNTDKIFKNERYRELHAKHRALELAIVKAELHDPDKLPDLQKQLKSIVVMKDRCMKALHFSKEDFIPVFKCPECEDTGFRKDGRACTCYPGSPPTRRAP